MDTGIVKHNIEFSYQLLDENACRRHIIKSIYQDGPRCRLCEASIDDKHYLRFFKNLEIYCRQCRSSFFPLAGTPFASAKISCAQIVLIGLLLQLGCRTNLIAELNNIDRHTVAHWRHKFKGIKLWMTIKGMK